VTSTLLLTSLDKDSYYSPRRPIQAPLSFYVSLDTTNTTTQNGLYTPLPGPQGHCSWLRVGVYSRYQLEHLLKVLRAMSFSGAYGEANDEDSLKVLSRAIELGCTFWDTAQIYGKGHNEELLGRFLKENPGAREKLFIGSKCGFSVCLFATKVPRLWLICRWTSR